MIQATYDLFGMVFIVVLVIGGMVATVVILSAGINRAIGRF